jgi:hypothetical protein
MRYAKGSNSISPERDVPILRLVRNAKFITHQQIFEMMQLSGLEYSRDSFNWRIKRLEQAQFVARCQGNFGRGELIYRISTAGLLQLEDHGHFAVVLNSTTEHFPPVRQVHHALELNAVHLALTRAGLLASWQSDVETASFNTISRNPLAKDYDAIVDVWNGQTMARFALEYERTLKSARQYQRIRNRLEGDERIGCVLYVTAGLDIAVHLAYELSGLPKRLAFATAPDFRQRLLDTPVLVHPDQPREVFRRLLRGLF